jgi:hypothetical protein
MRRAVTPVLRRRRLPHLAGSRCLPNPESSPWSLYSGAGLLRGGEGVHSSDDGDSLRTVDPHRFSRNRYLPLTFPAHRTTSAHADVGKRSEVAGAALCAVLSVASSASESGNFFVSRSRCIAGGRIERLTASSPLVILHPKRLLCGSGILPFRKEASSSRSTPATNQIPLCSPQLNSVQAVSASE